MRPSSILLLAVVCLDAAPLPSSSRVAIVGGGLAGLSTAINLIDGGSEQLQSIHVYDAFEVGCGGASAVAAGLLHPFTPKGSEIWSGTAGFAATTALVSRCEEFIGRRVSSGDGLLRLALTDEQADLLRAVPNHAEHAPLEQRWLSRDDASRSAGAEVGSGALGASLAPAALSIDTPNYLRALWALIEAEGAKANIDVGWCTKSVASLAALQKSDDDSYDAIIVASGARCADLIELADLSEVMRLCRGQNLLLENTGGLRKPLICGKYIVPVADGEHLLAGATFEYDPPESIHRPASADEASDALRASLEAMHPPLGSANVLGASAGVRALPPRSHLGYVPLTGRLPTAEGEGEGGGPIGGTWLFTGLGSRGLIHHALVGAAVADAVLSGDEARLPEHTRRCQEQLPRLRCWS